MKTIFAALLGATALVAPAMASDIYGQGSTKDGPSVSSGQSRSWTGFYIGAEVGGGAGVYEATRRAARGLDYQSATYTGPDGDDQDTERDAIRCCTQAYDENGVLKDGVEVETATTRLLNDNREDRLDLGLDGFFGGLNVEYRRQMGSRFVVGAFGNFDWGSMKGSDTFSRQVSIDGAVIDAFKGTTGSADYALATESGQVSIERKWNGDAGVKLGYLATPDTLVYGLVAATWGRFNIKGGSDISLLDGVDRFSPYPASAFNKDETKLGLKLGGGVETRLADRLNLGVEGTWSKYRGLGDNSSGSIFYADPDCPDQGIIASTKEGIDGDLGIWEVKATLRYQLTN